MSTAEQIKKKLEEFGDDVFYGAVPVTSFADDDPWNFITFQREPVKVSKNATSIARSYCVVVSRESEIPEGFEEEIIEAVTSIPGIKLATDVDVEYSYAINPNSHVSVEACEIHFRKGEKL